MNQLGLRIAESANSLDPGEPGRGGSLDLGQLAAIARRRRRAILWPLAVLLGLGMVYLATTPRSYQAASAVLLDAEVNPAVAEIVSLDGRRMSEAAIENARLVLLSDAVAQAVAARLTPDQVDSLTHPPQSLAGRVLGGIVGLVRLPVDLLRPAPPATPETGPEAAAAASEAEIEAQREALRLTQLGRLLRQNLAVNRIGRSAALSVSYGSHDPVLAATVANGFAEAYVEDVFGASAETTARAAEWLDRRLTQAGAAAQAAAAAAEAFRAEKGLVSTGGVFLAEEAVRRLNADLTAAVTEAARARALAAAYEAALARGPEGLKVGIPISSTADGAPDPALDQLQSALATAVSDLARVEADFGAGHPQARRLAQATDQAVERLRVALAQRLERSRGELAVAEARVAALRDSLDEALGDSAAAGGAQVELRALEQRAATLSSLYQVLLARAEEVEQARSLPVSTVRILALAEVPRAAQGPRASRVLGAALLLGLMIGVALAALREWRGRGLLNTGEDVRRLTGQEFLGYVPEVTAAPSRPARAGAEPGAMPGRRGKIEVGSAVFWSGRRAAGAPAPALGPRGQGALRYAEAVQGLRLALDLRPGGAVGGRAIGITSLNPGEGKTTLARDLAAALAQGGATVLLIDAHPRSPALSRAIGATTGPGLAEAVLGTTPWAEAVRRTAEPGLSVLPCLAGVSPGRAAQVLAARGFRVLVDEARERYDHILVDLPPLTPFVEAKAAMRVLARVVLVARAGRTSAEGLAEAISADPVLAERIAGVVLNRVRPADLAEWSEAPSAASYLVAYRAA
jgi:succinoglycan biosynthesis transport protein ExoP